MAKRQKIIPWNPDLPWAVNLQLIIAARRAAAREWSAARRRKHGEQVKKRFRRKWAAGKKRLVKVHKERWARGPRPKVGQRRLDQIVRVMQPGEWYAGPDIERLTGLPNETVMPILYQPMTWRGLVERARNAEARGERCRPGDTAPRTLWRLTEAGERLRVDLAMLE